MATVMDVASTLSGEEAFSRDALISPDGTSVALLPMSDATAEVPVDRPVVVVDTTTYVVNLLDWHDAEKVGVYQWPVIPNGALDTLVAETPTSYGDVE